MQPMKPMEQRQGELFAQGDSPPAAELEERERRASDRRITDAHLPRVKTLDEFDFRQAPLVSPTRMSELAEGGHIERAEPIVFVGDSGTGKTHLLSALCVAACRQRFTTAAALVKELVEAKQQLLSSAASWAAGRATT
jgi:DNA replication protein DnaC